MVRRPKGALKIFLEHSLASLIPRRAVVVEFPSRKLEMLSRRREALFANSDICQPTNLSNTLDNTGNIEIGLSSSLVVGLSTLGMGDTLAIFQSFGKYASVIQLLMIQVRGPAKWSATSSMNTVGIWSTLEEQSVWRKQLKEDEPPSNVQVLIWGCNY